MTNPVHILRVAVPRPLFQLLDYLPLEGDLPLPGCRVRVPFGPAEVTGVVVSVTDESRFENLRQIIAVLDQQPLLDAAMLSLLQWASRYYHYPPGEVVMHALPKALRQQRKVPETSVWQCCTKLDPVSLEGLQRAPKQLAVFSAIRESAEGVNRVALQEQFGSSVNTILRTLAQKQLIEQSHSAFYFSPPVYEPAIAQQAVTLTDEQQACVAQITQAKTYLLHGVTGSGKTEVYLHTIAPLLAAGKQVLILVPEIGLTPQLLSRFRAYFPDHSMVVMHSGLADGERMQAWLAAQTGQVDILIGTRSAIFVPMPRLGMIIIDEEHDSSFKQQEGFHYHARDLAVKRAHDAKIPVVLGSATPALESLHNASQGRYQMLSLTQRPGSRAQPAVMVQDIRGLPLESGVCAPLLGMIREHIDAGNQVMLFLNRRGFAPAMICPACGWHAECPHCDANMTYHAHSQKLICHRCDAERPVHSTCPQCGNKHITTRGQGTERVEQKLQAYFPTTRMIRIDRDTTRRKGALQKKLDGVNDGKPAILIGTQMLAKGHDFPRLTLVGILDVDQSLFSTDFRAWERLAQLIIQVAGRAGRADRKGTVVLQSTQPDHPFFQTLLSQGYLAIANLSLTERKNWHFPPFAYQALIRANAEKQENALHFLQQVKALLEPTQSSDLVILGPAPSPIEKRARRYRTQLLITATRRKLLHQTLNLLIENSKSLKKKGGVRWSIDVDPIDYV